jgi:hypothetical protein
MALLLNAALSQSRTESVRHASFFAHVHLAPKDPILGTSGWKKLRGTHSESMLQEQSANDPTQSRR